MESVLTADVHAAVVAGVDVADAVEGELILRRTRAVHREIVGAGAGAADRVVDPVVNWHARNQLRHIQRIAAVHFDVFDLFTGNGCRPLDAFGLQHGRCARNLDGLGNRADFEHEVADR